MSLFHFRTFILLKADMLEKLMSQQLHVEYSMLIMYRVHVLSYNYNLLKTISMDSFSYVVYDH